MTLKYFKYQLLFKQPFSIAHGTRTSTDAVYVTIEHNDLKGYGEAAFPPYLEETTDSAIEFFKKIDLKDSDDVTEAIQFVQDFIPGNYGAKAALDMTLLDLYGKQLKQPLHKIWNLKTENIPPSLFTIGMGTPEQIIEKIVNADAELFKVKLGGPFDKQIIETLLSVTDKPFAVDANQGWPDAEFAIDMIHWLKENGCVFVEQPLNKNAIDEQQKLFEKSALPVIADEAMQTISDLLLVKEMYHGINVKLMKCGGLSPAKKIIETAKGYGLKVLIGCMSEGSCSCTAAAQLAPLADWLDLDGPLLIKNDLFEGILFENGKLILPARNGTGVLPVSDFRF